MATGTILRLVDRGFGFIAPASGSGDDIFFHSSAVADNGFNQLQEGQKVTFEQEADPRNPSRQRATAVTPVTADSEV